MNLTVLGLVGARVRVDIVSLQILSVDAASDSRIRVSVTVRMEGRLAEIGKESGVREPPRALLQLFQLGVHLCNLLVTQLLKNFLLCFLELSLLLAGANAGHLRQHGALVLNTEVTFLFLGALQNGQQSNLAPNFARLTLDNCVMELLWHYDFMVVKILALKISRRTCSSDFSIEAVRFNCLLIDRVPADLNVCVLAYQISPSGGSLRPGLIITNLNERILLHLFAILRRESSEVLHELLFYLIPIDFALNLVLVFSCQVLDNLLFFRNKFVTHVISVVVLLLSDVVDAHLVDLVLFDEGSLGRREVVLDGRVELTPRQDGLHVGVLVSEVLLLAILSFVESMINIV